MATTLDRDAVGAALAAAGDALALVDNGKVVWANDAASRLGDAEGLAALAEPAAGPRLVERAGHAFEVRATASGGAVLVHGRDVTDREAVRRAVAAADQFLSFASHELKGPLHVLGLASHLIEARAGKGEPAEASTVEQVRRQVIRLTRLINQLLDVTRVRQNRIELMLEAAPVGELVDAAIRAMESRSGDVRVTGPTDARVSADRTRAAEMIGELLDNAARYAPPGTPISVEIAVSGREATVAVSDQGPGVPPEQRPGLFEVAAQGRGGPRKSPRQGLGMGLFLARSLARLHGGDLDLDGTTRGARFVLRLPLA